jgi:hypothetical protein
MPDIVADDKECAEGGEMESKESKSQNQNERGRICLMASLVRNTLRSQ